MRPCLGARAAGAPRAAPRPPVRGPVIRCEQSGGRGGLVWANAATSRGWRAPGAPPPTPATADGRQPFPSRTPAARSAARRPVIAAASRKKDKAGKPAKQDEWDEAALALDYDALSDAVRTLADRLGDRLAGTPIYLIGMMGSGKSTVGKLVGAALRYQFFDTDALVEAAAGAPVAEVFAKDGEASFREAETAVLQALLPYKSVVVATGGGAPVKRENWGLMHHAVVAWLDGPPALLAARAVADGVGARPLLADAGADLGAATERVATLLESRRAQYAQADLRVPLAADAGTAGAAGAPDAASPALVAFRLLRALDARIDADAAAREDFRKFEIKGAGDVKTMRVVPAKDGDGRGGGADGGAAPAA